MDALSCYRCGGSLEKLTLPLSRRDQCPHCSVDLHVCLMCKFFAPQQLPEQCAEDDAEDVREKAQANFCDYFTPSETAFEPGRMTAQHRAEAQLTALFGGDVRGATGAEPGASERADDALDAAEALFKD